jgi:hypothetical protein
MIDDKHKFIFIHIPKTGGTSIEKVFNRQMKRHCKHLTMSDYENELKSDIEKYFIFSVIRNPWDRILSYYFWRKWGGGRLSSEGKSFKSWIDLIVKVDKSQMQESNNYCDNESQCRNFMMAIDSQFNSLTIDGELTIDYLIRFENFQDDFNIVCDKIGITRQKLPHKNKKKHKHYTEYYDDETKQIVAKKYAKDIEYFNYEFGE